MNIWSKTGVNAKETFNKIVDKMNFDSFGGPEPPKNWDPGAFYTSTKATPTSI